MRWIIVAALMFAGCKRASNEPPRDGGVEKAEEKKEADELPKTVKLDAAVIREAHVVTARAEKRRLAATIDLNGQIVPSPDAIALLSARASGRVTQVFAREGDRVRSGQLLANVSSQELARLRGEHAALFVKANAARQNAERLRALVEQRLGAPQEAATAAAEATALEAERDAVARTIRGFGVPLSGTQDPSLLEVRSPIAGQIVQRDAVPGQIVQPDHTLLTVADLTKAWFQAQVFEKDLARVQEGAAAEIRLNGFPDRTIAAKVVRVAAQVDPQSRTLTARLALLDKGAKVVLGLYGTARIAVAGEEDEERVVVPTSAITEVNGKKVVFALEAGGDFQWRPVKVGTTSGGLASILSGVEEGEAVVVSGVHTLKSALLKSTMGAEE